MLNLSLVVDRIFTLCHRGDLLHALTLLDEEEDINKVLKYFSYEHFYVIYCKVKVISSCLLFASHQVVICHELNSHSEEDPQMLHNHPSAMTCPDEWLCNICGSSSLWL